MNPDKQHRKLEKLQIKAEECLTREAAQKILRKADKAHRKLSQGTEEDSGRAASTFGSLN